MPDLDKDRWGGVAVALGVCAAIVTLAVYIPTLLNDFVNWDDTAYVVGNLNIRSLDMGFLKWVSTAVVLSNWHPLTMLSYGVDYALWGLNPMGYHLTNIILHALNTFLVALLGFSLAGRGRNGLKKLGPGVVATGVAAALLFGLHPLHVESVAWVSERKDVLSALFFILSLLAYLKYVSGVRADSGRRFNYGASLLLFVLALMSKPMAISLPIVLLIIDYYPLERIRVHERSAALKDVLVEKLPFFALSGAAGAVTLWTQQKGGSLTSIESIAITERVTMAIRGYAFYLYKTLVPAKLAPVYPPPWKGEVFDTWFFISALILVAITALCIYMAVRSTKRRRVFLAAWLYYLITLGPVIGLVQVGIQAAADRYMYLPSLGLFMLAGVGAGQLFERWTRARTVVIAAMVMVSALLAYGTIRQSKVWKDSLTLWSYELSLYPRRVPQAYTGRGAAQKKLGNFRRAIEDYSAAIALYPGSAKSYTGRGHAFRELGEFRRAVEDYDKAIALKPGYAQTYAYRGAALQELGEFGRAIEDYSMTITLKPESANIYARRAYVFERSGEAGRAIEDYSTAITLKPAEASYYYNRGLTYAGNGNIEGAIEDFARAIEIDPGFVKAYYDRAIAYSMLGRYAEAVKDLSGAIAIDPGNAELYRNRGVAYMGLGNEAEAAKDYETANKLR